MPKFHKIWTFYSNTGLRNSAKQSTAWYFERQPSNTIFVWNLWQTWKVSETFLASSCSRKSFQSCFNLNYSLQSDLLFVCTTKIFFFVLIPTCTWDRHKPSRGILDTRRPQRSKSRPQHRQFSQMWQLQTQNLNLGLFEPKVVELTDLLDSSTFPQVISLPIQITSNSEIEKNIMQTGTSEPKRGAYFIEKTCLWRKSGERGDTRRKVGSATCNKWFPTYLIL